MDKALVTFSNGETLELSENQLIIPIVKVERNGETYASQSVFHELERHSSDGLIPTICDLFYSCGFFSLVGNEKKVYCVNAVVSIERA